MREKFTHLPLTDGSRARLTAHAKKVITTDNGITSGRVKKGTGSDVVMVSPKRIFDGDKLRPVRGVEIPLRDLLGSGAYESQLYNWLHDAAKVSHFVLKDGNCRNLTLSNFEVVFNEVKEVKERKKYTRKKITTTTRAVDALSIAEQEALLSEVFPQMKGVSYAILRPDSASRIGSYAQADDVLQQTALALLQQVRSGTCNAMNRGQFFAYCFASTQQAAGWKLEAMCSGACLDVDHDAAEIRLLRVKRLEGELLERQGLSIGDNGESPIEGIDPVWLAKELELEAAEKSEHERQRIREEGGAWHGVDLEVGAEISAADLLEEEEDRETNDKASEDDEDTSTEDQETEDEELEEVA